jgi:hypothetical protein
MSTLRPTVAAAALLCALSTSAHAYERLTRTDCPAGIAWASDPQFYFNGDGVPAAEEADYRDATEIIMERVNLVGGTWFDFQALGSISTADDMVQNDYNEVGMTELDHSDDGWTLGWGPSWVNTRTCKIVEADMHLTNWDGVTWAFGVPADQGVNYWEANDSVGMTYFARPIILHELGHTFGLAHSDTSYSYMNYNVLPWSNRDDDKRVEPLADDREALREIYPRHRRGVGHRGLYDVVRPRAYEQRRGQGLQPLRPLGGHVLVVFHLRPDLRRRGGRRRRRHRGLSGRHTARPLRRLEPGDEHTGRRRTALALRQHDAEPGRGGRQAVAERAFVHGRAAEQLPQGQYLRGADGRELRHGLLRLCLPRHRRRLRR